MAKMYRKWWAALTLVLVWSGLTAGQAYAVDPPKWVAALYVEAQKMVGLRWTPIPGAVGYKIFRSTTAGSGYEEIGTSPAPQHFDKSVSPGETYYYVLQAVAGAETSANSAEQSVRIPGVKVKKAEPPQWSQTRLTTSTELGKTVYKVGLLWKPVSGALAFNVYRSLTPGEGYELLSSTSEPRTVDASVEAGKTYYYVLTALDQTFQETAYSEERAVEVKEEETAAPGAVKKEYPKNVPIASTKAVTKKLPSDPFDVVVSDDGTIYVSLAKLYAMDDIEGDLTDITPSGTGVQIGNIGLGLEGEVLATRIGSGTVYIIDGSSVEELTIPPLEKAFKTEAGKVVPIKKPYAFDATQNIDGKYWVTDNANNRVVIFDEDRNFVGHAGVGTPYELVPNSGSITHNSAGLIFATSGSGNYVNIYDAEGTFVAQFGETGNIAGTFGRIGGVTVDSQDFIWISDLMNGSVQKFDSEGKFVGSLSSPDKKASAGLYTPGGMAVASGDKRIFVTQGIDKSLAAVDILE